MKSVLALVDMDNLLGAWGRSGPPGAGRLVLPMISGGTRWVTAEPDAVPVEDWTRPVGACDVVLGMNLSSVTRPLRRGGSVLTWEWAQRFGDGLARRLTGRGAATVRVGLTLSGPESVDSFLELLVSRGGLGRGYDQLVVLTHDSGLHTGIRLVAAPLEVVPGRARLPRRPLWKVPSGADRDRRWVGREVCHSWRVDIPPRPDSPAESEGAPEALPEGWSVPLMSAGAAVAACARTIDVEAAWDLAGFCKAIAADRPHVLSQVGPTTASVAGLERLAAWRESGERALGRVWEGDGVEVTTTSRLALSHTPGRVEMASVGAGAAHLVGCHLTLRSSTPPDALSLLGPNLPLALQPGLRASVADRSARALLARANTEAITGRLSFGRRGRSVVQAEVLREAGRPQSSWFVVGGRAKSKLRMDRGPRGRALDVRGYLRAVSTQSGLALGFAAPVTEGVLDRDVPPWSLGVLQHPEGGVAVLALHATLSAGRHEQLTRIQDLPLSALGALRSRWDWERLRLLPLLLPLSGAAGQAVSTAGAT